MMDVAFCHSAAGSLRAAQSYGKGAYPGGPVGIAFGNGKEPSPAEQRRLQKQLEEKMKAKWESAVPLGGTPQDVFCLSGVFSIGNIAGDGISGARLESFAKLFSCFPPNAFGFAEDLEETRHTLDALVSRAKSGEPLRIWYSDKPDEYCGLCWLMAQLKSRVDPLPPMVTIKLPSRVRKGSTLCQYQGWGEVEPGDFGGFLPLAEPVIPAFVLNMAALWQGLQQQNTPLRAVVNGVLQGVPENFYDPFIEAELQKMPDEFSEPSLVGHVIGRYAGIGDFWIAQRIEKMIESGRLIAVTAPPPGDRVYARILKKPM